MIDVTPRRGPRKRQIDGRRSRSWKSPLFTGRPTKATLAEPALPIARAMGTKGAVTGASEVDCTIAPTRWTTSPAGGAHGSPKRVSRREARSASIAAGASPEEIHDRTKLGCSKSTWEWHSLLVRISDPLLRCPALPGMGVRRPSHGGIHSRDDARGGNGRGERVRGTHRWGRIPGEGPSPCT